MRRKTKDFGLGRMTSDERRCNRFCNISLSLSSSVLPQVFRLTSSVLPQVFRLRSFVLLLSLRSYVFRPNPSLWSLVFRLTS